MPVELPVRAVPLPVVTASTEKTQQSPAKRKSPSPAKDSLEELPEASEMPPTHPRNRDRENEASRAATRQSQVVIEPADYEESAERKQYAPPVEAQAILAKSSGPTARKGGNRVSSSAAVGNVMSFQQQNVMARSAHHNFLARNGNFTNPPQPFDPRPTSTKVFHQQPSRQRPLEQQPRQVFSKEEYHA